MNRKGQSLALFITVIPLIVVTLIFLYNSCVFVNAKINAENTLEVVVKEAVSNNLSDDEIVNLLKANNYDDGDIEIVSSDNKKIVTIKIKYPVVDKIYKVSEEVKEVQDGEGM